MNCCEYNPRCLFTTLHFLHNLLFGPISQSVCPQQTFIAWCNVIIMLIWPTDKSQRKGRVVNTTASALFTTLHFLHNLRFGSISWSVCPQYAFTAKYNVIIILIWPIQPQVLYIHDTFFLHNLQMGPISQCLYLASLSSLLSSSLGYS